MYVVLVLSSLYGQLGQVGSIYYHCYYFLSPLGSKRKVLIQFYAGLWLVSQQRAFPCIIMIHWNPCTFYDISLPGLSYQIGGISESIQSLEFMYSHIVHRFVCKASYRFKIWIQDRKDFFAPLVTLSSLFCCQYISLSVQLLVSQLCPMGQHVLTCQFVALVS